MARKETIYTVNKETGIIERASKSFLNAARFCADSGFGQFYMCTSEFHGLKKGDPITDITAIL